MLLKKIVVAEDDDAIAHMVSMALGDAGYLCLRARDGDEALRLVKAHDPDLLILDVMMPRVDGLEDVLEGPRDDAPHLVRLPLPLRFVAPRAPRRRQSSNRDGGSRLGELKGGGGAGRDEGRSSPPLCASCRSPSGRRRRRCRCNPAHGR